MKWWKRKLIKDLEVSLKSCEVCKMESLFCIFFYMLCIFINFQCLNRPISVSFLIRTSGKVKITVKLAGLCLNNFENKENSGKRAELCCILSSQSLVNFEKGKQLKRSKKFLHKVVKCEKLDLTGRGFCILYKFRRPCKIILQQYSKFK